MKQRIMLDSLHKTRRPIPFLHAVTWTFLSKLTSLLNMEYLTPHGRQATIDEG